MLSIFKNFIIPFNSNPLGLNALNRLPKEDSFVIALVVEASPKGNCKAKSLQRILSKESERVVQKKKTELLTGRGAEVKVCLEVWQMNMVTELKLESK
ncbi:hypothetical protein D6817_01725, partial [Candidatus Pacearchaeota archaeon]